MTTLSQLYKSSDPHGLKASAVPTWQVPIAELYAEPGYNIRDIDWDQIQVFRDAFLAGEPVPPLSVKATAKGVKIVDGHHRYYGAVMAIEAGFNITHLACEDLSGTEADRLILMLSRVQSKPLGALERAVAYLRLHNLGLSNAEIARRVNRSRSDITRHLTLLACDEELIAMVRTGEIAATTALALSHEYGNLAVSIVRARLKAVKAMGKKKLTRDDSILSFNATRARRLVELIAEAEVNQISGGTRTLMVSEEKLREILTIVGQYRMSAGKGSTSGAHAVEPYPAAKYPLAKTDMIRSSGIKVWACAAAAFGDKAEYTLLESKYAHLWAADDVEQPEVVVVLPPKRARVVQRKASGDSKSLRRWLDGWFGDADVKEEMFERFSTVAAETREERGISMDEFLAVAGRTRSESWANIRLLRTEIREVLTLEDKGKQE
ncbi:chromosome partitioning protein ParB [Erwinia sp. HDF1-3R]|uniref:ParB/RepB/Spo0J family partition protein n=1 Tax=Erwinia sp. HDF1-3R TaxID=3141543 RepID=UPI0031F4C507